MMKKLLLSTSLALSLFTIGCSDNKENKVSKELAKKANAMVNTTTFNLKDLNGTSYQVEKKLNNFKILNNKKIVLFDIFATWCPPCRSEATYLSDLQKKYKDDILIIGVSINKDLLESELESFAKKYDASYSLSLSSDNLKLARSIAASIKAPSQFPIPMMVVYVDGKYQTHYVGATPEEMIESDIKLILKNRKVSN